MPSIFYDIPASPNNSSHIAEGFPNERLILLPAQVSNRFSKHPIASHLYPLRMGFFPEAQGHYIKRSRGINEHVFILCFAGSGYISQGKTQTELKVSQCAFLQANKPHYYQANDDTPWSIGWIHFQGSLADEYIRAIRTSPQEITVQVSDMNALRASFEVIYALTQETHRNSILLSLHTALADLFSKVMLQKYNAQEHKQNIRIARVIDYLRNNLHRNIGLKEMARIANWTPNYFSTVFRQELNDTPASFFLHMKMAHACDLLRQQDEPIASIAERVGFEDAFYFSRCFRRCYHMSPSQFRKKD